MPKPCAWLHRVKRHTIPGTGGEEVRVATFDDKQREPTPYIQEWHAPEPLYAADALNAAQAEITELRKDAERYRWLKESQTIMYKPARYDGMAHGRWDMHLRTDCDDLDAVIDARMQSVPLAVTQPEKT